MRHASTPLNPRPDLSELGRIYPPNYGAYHFDQPVLTFRIRDRLEQRKVAMLRRYIPDDADVLDAGCGGPGFLDRLRQFGPPGWRLWGNDINPAAMAEVERHGFKTLPGRFEEMPAAMIFDAVILKQVIEHLDSPRTVVEGIARVLKPGGTLIIETPCVDAWDAKLFRRRTWAGYHFPRHWTMFDPATLRAMVERAENSRSLRPRSWSRPRSGSSPYATC